MLVGVTVDPLMHPNPDDLTRYDVVRFPVWDTQVAQEFEEQLRCRDIQPQIVCDKDTMAGSTSYERRFKRLRAQFPKVDLWQIGNEQDQLNSGSSWYRKPHVYKALLKSAVNGLGPNVSLLSGGLVSGQPSYLTEVGYYPFDKLCIHPYGRYPHSWGPSYGFGSVSGLLDLYVDLDLHKPLWITEFGAPDQDFIGESVARGRQAYHHDMLIELSDYGVEAALMFCHTCGVPGFNIDGKVRV